MNKLKENIILLSVIVIITAVYFLFPHETGMTGQPVESNNDQRAGSMETVMSRLNEIPDDFDQLVAMGNESMDAGNYAMAAELYRRALLIDSSANDLRVDFGACLHGMGLDKRALEEFHRALLSNPEHKVALYNVGIVYYNMGIIDSSRVYWSKFLELYPDAPASDRIRDFFKSFGG